MTCFCKLARCVKRAIAGASVLISIVSTSAHASYTCTGTVSNIAVAGSGRVSIVSTAIYGGSQGRDVCNLYTDFQGVSSATCKGWLAVLLTAQMSGRTVSIQYADSTYSCTTHPAWDSALAPWALFLN